MIELETREAREEFRNQFAETVRQYLFATGFDLSDIAREMLADGEYLSEALRGVRPLDSRLAGRIADAMLDLVTR